MEILDFTGTRYLERADARPTFGGTAASEIGKTGSVALIQFGGQNYTVEIGMDGKFSWTSPVDVADGEYSLSIIIQDRAGNQSAPILRTAIIDTTPPEAPTLLNLYDDQGHKKAFLPGETTDDKRPTLTGSAQKGSIVILRDAEDTIIGSAKTGADGIWKMDPSVDLKDGTNNLTLEAQETFAGAERTSGKSQPFSIIIASDGVAPGTITINNAYDDAGEAMGTLSDGALTNDTTPTLNGDVSTGESVVVYYRLAGSNVWAGSATATISGDSWSWTPDSALGNGLYEFQASSGDVSSALFSLDIASAEQILQRTRIESALDDFGQDRGPLADGAITDDATPTLLGRAEANGRVVIRYSVPNGDIATVVVDADSGGNWRWTPESQLASGIWSFDVQPQGESAWSKAFTLQISGSGENDFKPEISYAFDDVGSSTGARYNGDTTDDTTPTLHGKAQANSVVYIQATQGAEVQVFSVQTDAASNWQWTPPAELTKGSWSFQVSKGAGDGWGEAFRLNIGSTGSYSGEVDFENPPPGFAFDYVVTNPFGNRTYIYKTHIEGISLVYTDNERAPKIGKVVGGPTSFGSHALILCEPSLTNKVSDLTFDLHNYLTSRQTIKSFSFEVYNPSSSTQKMYLNMKGNFIGLSEDKNFTFVTIGAKQTRIITEKDFPKGFLDKSTQEITIGSNSSSEVWIDNFKYQIGDFEKKTTVASEDDQSLHYLNGVDELTNLSLIGNEQQIDTLIINGKDQVIDLTTLEHKLESVEVIDITGSGDNTLKLDLSALLLHGEKDLFIADGKTQLVVKGDAGDVVQLKDILPEGSDLSEWQHQEGSVTVAGVEYQVYSHGDDAELLVQQGVKTELI